MRDVAVGRNYYALKLACWLTQGSYWVNTLTTGQAFNLVERSLNHPEVHARWPQLVEIDVQFPERAITYASAERRRGGKGLLRLPKGTLSPLIILHEVAHLLPTTKREADHGPGFTAIHLMLVELLAPTALRPMLAAYHATGMEYDPSLIPAPCTPSTYVPIVTGAPLHDSITHMRALLASGVLTPVERRRTESAIQKLKRKGSSDHVPLQPLPPTVQIKTADLLRCSDANQIAAIVLDHLRDDLLPERMRRPANKTGKK